MKAEWKKRAPFHLFTAFFLSWGGAQTMGPVHPPEKIRLRPGAAMLPFPRLDPAGMKSMAGLRGLASLHRDLALICGETSYPTDAAAALPDCEAALVEKGGRLLALNRKNLLAAQRLPGNRMLLLQRDLSLFLRDASGRESLLAVSVAEPRVSEDGATVIFTQYPPGTAGLEPGLAGKLAAMGIDDGKRRIVTEDRHASSPFPVPGTEEVLFLSARTGLASIWIAAPGKPDRQLTNIGKIAVDKEFIPVFGRELVWVPGSRKAVYTAHYGTHSLWVLDIDRGKARKLGPGRLPAMREDGSVLAASGDPAIPETVSYSLEGYP